MKIFTDQPGGVKINRRMYGDGSGCPAWAKQFAAQDWGQRGVVVWDETAQRIEHLFAEKALVMLERLHAADDWKSSGFPITRTVTHHTGSPAPQPKSSRKKEARQEELPSSIPESKSETVEEECFRLTPSASAEFLEFLMSNEAALHEVAEEEIAEWKRTLADVYKILLQGAPRRQLNEIDLSTRPLPWTSDKQKCQLVCEVPPNRGTVMLKDGHWFWQGCVERPDRFKHASPFFVDLDKALTWVEEELSKPPEEASEPEDKPSPLTSEQLECLRPYWIEPSALEPERITYRVVVDLETQPVHFKKMEMSFGKEFRYDGEYLPPTMLARELNLDADRLEVEQFLGPKDGWYRIKLLVTYLNEPLAISQAQQLWDQSRIAEQYKAGKIIRAWYGIDEVETNFTTILGVCDKPDSPWLKPRNRAEHMKWQALRETIVQAAIVVAFRSFLGLSQEDVSDNRLLETLHKQRTKSKRTSAEARIESERWLRQHIQRAN